MVIQFNKSTCFLDGKIIHDFNELNYVLENFEKIDPIMLELLHYTQDVVSFKDRLGRSMTKKLQQMNEDEDESEAINKKVD